VHCIYFGLLERAGQFIKGVLQVGPARVEQHRRLVECKVPLSGCEPAKVLHGHRNRFKRDERLDGSSVDNARLPNEGLACTG
jgi:hypothetical protein